MACKLTIEEVVKKFREVHGDKYNYNKVIYNGNNIKVKIYCNECEDYFEQTPHSHKDGHGCIECAKKERQKKMSLSIGEFIKKAIKIHGDKYKYDKVKYINAHTKVKIYCDGCEDYFEQKPNNHLNGHGCDSCMGRPKLTKNEFIKKAIKIHGDKYKYEKVNYINSETKVKIYCNECEAYFEQIPSGHLDGKGCKECGMKRTIDHHTSNTNEFVKKAIKIYGDKYKYDKVNYVHGNIEVKIYCNECEDYFEQKPNRHLNNGGCVTCGRKRTVNFHTSNTNEFIKKSIKIHGNKYKYDKVNYVHGNIKVKIYCNECEDYFEQKPKNHYKNGCPICYRKNNFTPIHLLTKWEKYRKNIRKYTYRNKKHLFDNWDGYDYYDGEYIRDNFKFKYYHRDYPTIDHKKSVFYCFMENISSKECSSLNNLCITKKRINSSKRTKTDDEYFPK